ncbi:hypothetical protein EV188_10995 [Actinomycetospora succinea]|uniref:Uncharacterized protein n=1 Tax=Actinomycetospora succinea TaxID=663603 RepID=A0A4V3D896_9PSEU|nr:hypothetical protein [Actinomycetospora succinea]TDQ50887.1 hypothetical protein EV188_10995 [Actinomycetospora succinea]
MIVQLSADSAHVAEPDDCARLHVTTSLPADAVDGALRGAGIGRLDAEDALLDLEVLRTRARAGAREPDWDEKWTKMIDYARSKGWVTPDDGAVRAHVEYGADR